jgi:hypothetical protein
VTVLCRLFPDPNRITNLIPLNQMTRLIRLAGLLALLVLTGCSQGTATVSGKITRPGGQPLPGGRVTFHAVGSDKKVFAEFGADGEYMIEGVPAGEYRVAIDNGYLKNAPPAPQLKAGPEPGAAGVGIIKYVPMDTKYASPDTSGLTANVPWGSCTRDFEVK